MRQLLFILMLSSPILGLAQLDFDTALDVLGNHISNKVYLQEKSKVAVANLVDHLGEENELGSLISEELTVALLKHSRGFEVMDRDHLQAIFEEHKLAMGGLMNDSTLIQIGKMESVEVIITGSIVKLGNRYKVTIKALDTETAMVIAADKEYFTAERYLDEYYGIETPLGPIGPEPVESCPVDPKPVLAPRHDEGYGTVYVNNAQPFPLLLSLKNSNPKTTCKDYVTFEVRSGHTVHVKGMCKGNVEYEARNGYTGEVVSQGTVYLKTCSEKVVRL